MAIAAMIVVVLVVRFAFQEKPKEDLEGEIMGETDTTQTEKKVLPIEPKDTSKQVIAEKETNAEEIKDKKPQIVEVDTSPKPFQIPEYTISSRLGFAGKGQPNAKRRWILIYPKSPSDDIKDPSKVHYLFDDTLRFYGRNINAQELQLLYLQNDSEYLLVQKTDTLEIFKYPKWRLLRR
ncbi:MAG: hypothetical protein HC912_05920 [Saprospiraceae bacterium]|nr:hypothetical protein [Saprospiraceae bacterium]